MIADKKEALENIFASLHQAQLVTLNARPLSHVGGGGSLFQTGVGRSAATMFCVASGPKPNMSYHFHKDLIEIDFLAKKCHYFLALGKLIYVKN